MAQVICLKTGLTLRCERTQLTVSHPKSGRASGKKRMTIMVQCTPYGCHGHHGLPPSIWSRYWLPWTSISGAQIYHTAHLALYRSFYASPEMAYGYYFSLPFLLTITTSFYLPYFPLHLQYFILIQTIPLFFLHYLTLRLILLTS